ncbi:MAG: hypothetical protein WCW14_00175 [Candidatus Paceibacterota bacterium]|jgi:hypothetical protein
MHVVFDEFWKRPEMDRLERAHSFHDLANIAIQFILPRMAITQKEVIQLCGPISTGGLGTKEANIKRFKTAIRIAKRKNLLVFDQMPFERAIAKLSAQHAARGEYCDEILTVFYAGVFSSKMISKALFSPDWHTSKGAAWGREHLTKIGLPIEDYPADWMAEVNHIMAAEVDPHHCG